MELVLEEPQEKKSGKQSNYSVIVDEAILGNWIIKISPSGQAELCKITEGTDKAGKATKYKKHEGSYANVGECLKKLAFHKLVEKHRVLSIQMFFEEFKKIDASLRHLLVAIKPETQSIIDTERNVAMIKNQIAIINKRNKEIEVLDDKLKAQAKEIALMRNQLNTLYNKVNS